MSQTNKQDRAKRRRNRVRALVAGTAARPRVSTAVSLSGMFVQFIDDQTGRTLVSGRTAAKSKGTKTEAASVLGKVLGEKALAAGIKTVVFDRGAKQYHGRLKALAEALRGAGLKF